jgi:hypothetical protein
MATPRPRPLGSGARLRRDRSMLADAQRRYTAAAESDAVQSEDPIPNPSPQGAFLCKAPQGAGEQAAFGASQKSLCGAREEAVGSAQPPHDTSSAAANLTPLTQEARALYEAGVVPVLALARLCGVSVAGLYYHVRKQGWRRRRSAVPRDPARAARQRQRRLALKASRPSTPRGLKARDPKGQALALAAAERAGALAGAALARAVHRQDAEARARMLAMLGRALRDLAVVAGEAPAKRRDKRPGKERGTPGQKPGRKRAAWRPMFVTPLAHR